MRIEVRIVAVCIAALGVACSNGTSTGGFNSGGPTGNNSTGSGGGGTSSNGSPANSSGGSTGSSGGSEIGLGSSSGNASEDASAPDDASAPSYSDAQGGSLFDTNVSDSSVAQVVNLTMTPFTVMPGAEVYKCQQFANPFGGNDVNVIKMVGQMSEGSHHFFVFNMAPSTGRNTALALEDCPGAGLEFHPFPFLSQSPAVWTVTYPQANMGYPIKGANGIMLNVHYLNAGSNPINSNAYINFSVARPGVVTVPVGTIFLNNVSMTVPANTPMSSPVVISQTLTPSISTDYNIITSWQHMHQYALDFQASMNGNVFYESKQWEMQPLTVHNPFLKVPTNTGISFQCTYYNPTSNAMYFGDSAATAVMCIYIAQYYPADPSLGDAYPDYVNPL